MEIATEQINIFKLCIFWEPFRRGTTDKNRFFVRSLFFQYTIGSEYRNRCHVIERYPQTVTTIGLLVDASANGKNIQYNDQIVCNLFVYPCFI